jgi:predicted metal-dependent enzyme (double-stranded beta helix superfamily)
MVRVRYALEEFIADMQALVAAQPGQATLFDRGSALLERFVRDPEALPEEFRVPSGKGMRPNHGSYALHRGDGLFVSAVVWGAGDGVGPHDHLTWGMIGVMGNAIEETRFRRLDDGGAPGRARLARDRATVVKPGEVSLLTPETDEIHQMHNGSNRPTVEVHVYGRDLVGLPRHAYDLETGEVRAFTSGKFDNC